ncbi:tyrosine-type recombinase/integrase [Candidatus Latescibacterota bacterium]
MQRQRRASRTPTDYARILDAYEVYALEHSKSKRPDRKSHRNHMSMARQTTAWLQDTVPDIADLASDSVREYQRELEGKYSGWTVWHRVTKLRLLLDQAVHLGMLSENPARELTLRQPKVVSGRRILTGEEIHHLLDCSPSYRQWMHGGLPSAVRLGLYAGLRNEEMCWAKWEWLDTRRRVLTVQRSVCELTGEEWIPKDYEMRRLDVKSELVDYLEGERTRQQNEGLFGPFILPAGGRGKMGYFGKPLSQGTPQKAFARMIAAEEIDPAVTLYSLRHTYATMLLRNHVELRTVQSRLGHSSIRTTESYLHEIEPEGHPTDRLPY